MEYIIFENHFGVHDKEIRALTRNNATNEIIFIISDIAKKLYPDISLEISFLPSEEGSYKDILKIASNHPLATFNVIIAVGTLGFQYLIYKDSHEEYLYNKENRVIEQTQQCLDFQKQLLDYEKEGLDITGIPEDKIKEICGDIKLTKSKNNFYQTLRDDEKVLDNEIVIKKNDTPIKSSKIPKNEFQDYIAYIPENEKFIQSDVEGIVEIVAPVLRQKKEGRGKPWSGIYYGEDIIYKGLPVLSNGESINFYMQDEDFKKQIYGHKITFGNGDNISVIFSFECDINIDIVKNKNVYISQVNKWNDDIIQHKQRLINKKNYKDSSVQTLF